MRVLIAGCGYLGRRLGQSLVSEGHEVVGVCRSFSSVQLLESLHIFPIQLDLVDAALYVNLPRDVDVVVCAQARSSASESYESTYYQITTQLLRYYSSQKPPAFIFISSTSVYGVQDGAWVDETTDLLRYASHMNENAQVLMRTEQEVLKYGGMVLRLSGIYGPGRHRLEAMRKGTFMPSFGEGYTNRIFVADAVSAIEIVMKRGTKGETYCVTDDLPVTGKELYGWIYEQLGLAVPSRVAGVLERGSKRVSNRKLKQLGWELRYPSYREGYGELIE